MIKKRFHCQKRVVTCALFFVFVIGLCPFTIGISGTEHKHFFVYAESERKKAKKVPAPAAAAADTAAETEKSNQMPKLFSPALLRKMRLYTSMKSRRSKRVLLYGLFLRHCLFSRFWQAGFYYFYRFVTKKAGVGLTGQDVVKVIAAVPIGQNRMIQIVDMAGKLLVLGVTDSNINLISEIKERDEIDRIKLLSSKSQAVQAASSFQEFLNVHIHGVVDFIQNRGKAPHKKDSSAQVSGSGRI